MCLFWSLKGKGKFWGRAYPKRDTASIFLHLIYRDAESYGDFMSNLLWTMYHEYLHLFFTNELGQWGCSCKTKIDPVAERLTVAEVTENPKHVQTIIDDWVDVGMALKVGLDRYYEIV